MRFNCFQLLPSTFDELVSLVRPFVVRKGSISFFVFPTSVIKERQFSHWFDKLFFVDEFSCRYFCPTSETLPFILKQSVAPKMDFFISDASWRIHEKTRCVRIAEVSTNHIWSASWRDASRHVQCELTFRLLLIIHKHNHIQVIATRPKLWLIEP